MKNKIRELRQKAGMTGEYLALLCGIHKTTLYAIEKGRYNPSARILWRLTRVLNCSFNDLGIDFSDEEPEPQEFLKDRIKAILKAKT